MPHHLNLTLLHTLVTISKTGSLSAAAPRLFKSQSAVSEQVRKLEQIYGLPLLIRGKTGARLTAAGARLVEHAERILDLSDMAYRDMQGAQLSGKLHLAITDYFRPSTLPGILKRVREQFPQLQLYVSILKSAHVEAEMEKGTFDIGISMTILRGGHATNDNDRIRLSREPLHWIADKSFIVPDSKPMPLVVLPDTCSLQRLIVDVLKGSDLSYEITHTASGVGGLHLALSAGLGVSCLNASAIPEGIAPFTNNAALPALPDVEFTMVPPRKTEAKFVSDVRNMLAEQLR